MSKIDFYFLIKYKNSRICKNKNVLFDWLIYNRQPPRNPRFCVAKIYYRYLKTDRGRYRPKYS